MTSLQSPIQDRHSALGAKFADFGGWQMPIEYAGGGVIAEHTSVRERVGLFDVSHLGKVSVRGAGAQQFVNSCFTADLAQVDPGFAQYTFCCNETGGVIDDLIAYVRSSEDVFLIPNAANAAQVAQLLAAAAPADIVVTDHHRDYAIVAVQGPRSTQMLESLEVPAAHDYLSFVHTQWRGMPVMVCRSGYTGERGYELVSAWADAPALWDALTGALARWQGLTCGLGARDTLRTEMGYPLHGNDIGPEITPVMAASAWAVGWDKPQFWGKEALVRQRGEKSGRLLQGLLVTERGIPRRGCVVRSAGTEIGTVTSGTFGPTVKQGIALALLDRGVAVGDQVQIDVRGRPIAAVVTKPPFVQSNPRET